MSKKFINTVICAVLVLTIGVAARASDISVSVACDASPDSITGIICDMFKKVVEEKSGGSIEVNVYPSAQLGSDREAMESLRSGELEFTAMTAAPQTTDVPALNVFDMFCAFENLDVARKAVDNVEFRRILQDRYNKAGIHLLFISDQSFRETSSNKPVRSMDDFKGLKIRTMENPVHVGFWRALGANPTPMSRGEVFLSLQQGLLDAQEDPYISTYLYNYAEVQKYIIDTHHLFHSITFITNKDFWDELTDEQRTIFQEAGDEVLAKSRELSLKTTAEYRQKLIDDGVEAIVLGDDVMEGMRKIAEKEVWPMAQKSANDSEIVNAFIKATEEARASLK